MPASGNYDLTGSTSPRCASEKQSLLEPSVTRPLSHLQPVEITSDAARHLAGPLSWEGGGRPRRRRRGALRWAASPAAPACSTCPRMLSRRSSGEMSARTLPASIAREKRPPTALVRRFDVYAVRSDFCWAAMASAAYMPRLVATNSTFAGTTAEAPPRAAHPISSALPIRRAVRPRGDKRPRKAPRAWGSGGRAFQSQRRPGEQPPPGSHRDRRR